VTSAVRLGSPAQRGRGADERVVERVLPATANAARLARVTVQVACSSWRVPEVCEVAVLAVSELVGNAVRHSPDGGGTLTLRLSMTPRRLRVEVVDPSPGPGRPTVKRPPADAESGRGLWLVSELATRWGVEPDGAGTRVWVEVALEP